MQVNLGKPYSVRGSCTSILVLAGLVGIPTGVTILAAYQGTASWMLAMILVAILSLVLIWPKSVAIEIVGNKICYQTLFFFRKEIRLADVDVVQVEVGCRNYWDRFKPTVRLAVRPRLGTNAKPLVVNLRLFRQKDIKRVLSLLDVKV